jgi:hypothetical protein
MKSREAEQSLTIEDLRRRFKFDLEEGEIYLRSNGNQVDKEHHFRGQSSSNTRYKQVQFGLHGEMVKICAHRMIWAVVHGRWPNDGMVIDHLNSDTHDNRPCNLKEETIANNARRVNQR